VVTLILTVGGLLFFHGNAGNPAPPGEAAGVRLRRATAAVWRSRITRAIFAVLVATLVGVAGRRLLDHRAAEKKAAVAAVELTFKEARVSVGKKSLGNEFEKDWVNDLRIVDKAVTDRRQALQALGEPVTTPNLSVYEVILYNRAFEAVSSANQSGLDHEVNPFTAHLEPDEPRPAPAERGTKVPSAKTPPASHNAKPQAPNPRESGAQT